MGLFNRKSNKKKKETYLPEDNLLQEIFDNDYENKKDGLEQLLGKMHGMVGHAIIPFSIGGSVDMYYFPNHFKGTGFATMELLDPMGNGPLPNNAGTYELVAFTKEILMESVYVETAYNLIERRICGIFTTIGNYSFQAVLNPGETCELPSEGEDNKCLIFDMYQPDGKAFTIGERTHHLLLCIEVFRTEMDFARENGSVALLKLLKQKGFYPYSDLDRAAVV